MIVACTMLMLRAGTQAVSSQTGTPRVCVSLGMTNRGGPMYMERLKTVWCFPLPKGLSTAKKPLHRLYRAD